MTTTTSMAGPVARYAQRLHTHAGSTHHVASGLGAWLLLALVAPAATGTVRDELTAALGLDPAAAAAVAAAALDNPHPLLPSASAAWWRETVDHTPGLTRWSAGLPAAVSTGELPDQNGLDAWAREHTLGLIDQFPLTVKPWTVFVLATALAARVKWLTPFDVVPSAALGPDSAWAGDASSGRLTGVLRTPAGPGHDQFIVASDRCGDLLVHSAVVSLPHPAEPGRALWVTSVAAAPDVPATEVLATAHEVAVAIATGAPVPRRSLFDLPVGQGPLWTVTEERVRTTADGGREEHCVAVMPAWSARSDHDLKHPDLGLPAAAAALARMLALPDYDYEAKQVAVARFDRTGFEAAAVSAAAVLVWAPVEVDGIRRTATLRFAHPYAVVAVTTDRSRLPERPLGAWHGVPVFSAWVADPDDSRADG